MLSIQRLPPYSPFLNIVENTFSVWKAGIKRRLAEMHEHLIPQSHAERMTDLATVGEVAVGDVTVDMAQSFFRLMQGRLPECFNRSDMFM